jgi:uncharacterized SAM-binding protein YcdF (DUF218 family)
MLRAIAMAILCVLAWILFIAGLILREPHRASGTRADGIVVLGAAVIGERPSPVFEARLDEAAMLFREKRARYIVLTGARSAEDRLSEAAAGRSYLLAQGVPAEALLMEENSRTTVENLREAKLVADRNGLRSLLVVTDGLHLFRSRLAWQRLGMNAQGAPARSSRYRGLATQARFALRELAFVHAEPLMSTDRK